MAGLLADIGRSNMTRDAQSLFGDVMRYRQQDNQDAAQILNAQHQEKQMAIAQAAEARSKAEFDKKNELVDIDTFRQGLGDHTFEVLKGAAAPYIKYVDTPLGKKGYISRGDAAGVPAMIKTNGELRTEASRAKLADFTTQKQALDEQINKLTEKGGDEAQITQLTKQRDGLVTQTSNFVSAMLASDPEHQKKVAIEKAKYEGIQSKLGPVAGDSESGDMFYNSPKGLVTAQGVAYDPQAHGNLTKAVEPVNTINEFQTFYRGMKEQNPGATEADISAAWSAKKAKELESRIPAFTSAPGVPPGYVLNRRTGNYDWKGEGPAPGMSPEASATFKADSASLQNQTKMTDMMKSFVGNMNAQVDRISAISKDVQRFDARLLNVPMRELKMRVAGSAIESKVGMYLTEISNEIGKLSTGSQASVRELSESAQRKWEKIHDPNLSIKDLMSLLNETKHAGTLRLKSATDVISQTKKRLGGGNTPPADNSDPYGIR